jgi:hypothetical protein
MAWEALLAEEIQIREWISADLQLTNPYRTRHAPDDSYPGPAEVPVGRGDVLSVLHRVDWSRCGLPSRARLITPRTYGCLPTV